MDKLKTEYNTLKTYRNMIVMELENMEFWGYHGCLEEERVDGNEFTVDFRGEVEDGGEASGERDGVKGGGRASESDCLEDTLDYSAVYKVIEREMGSRSNLLEHIAGRIVRALKEEFPQIVRCSVRVSKKNPPVGGKVAWARVTMGFDREKGD